MEKTSSKFFKNEIYENAVVTFSIKVISLFLSYFYLYYLSRNFGAHVVGIINIANSSILIASLFATLGFDQSILRFAGQFGANKTIFFEIYKKMGGFIFLSSVLITLFIFIFRNVLAHYLTKEEGNSLIFGLVSMAVFFLALTNLNVETIRGLLYVKESEIFRTFLTNFINLVLFFLLVNLIGFKLALPVITNILGIILTCLISVLFIIKKFHDKTEDANISVNLTSKEIFQISIPLFLVALANLISSYSPVLILAYLKTPKDVGIFNVAHRIATVTSFFLVSINSIVAPKISETYWSGKKEELKRIINLSAKLNFWSSTPLLLLFILFPKYFMGFFGKEFISGFRALMIMSFGQFVNAFCGSVGYLLTMTGNQNTFKNIFLLSAILNLILCFLLIPVFGFDGAAMSFSVSMIFWNVVSLLIVKKKFGFVTYYLPFLKKE